MESKLLDIPGWERVVHFTDANSGLSAIISVHDATLGPGCGGCRVFPYATFEDGLDDVKNLSRGMTYKNALGDIPFGGGKAIVFADHRSTKTAEMMTAFGRAVESFAGLYYTAEDSGVSEDDMKLIRSQTEYVAGFVTDGKGGNPSPFTARGVWRGMQAASRAKFGDGSLAGKRVSILGVGAVGMELARLVHEEGGELVVADVNDAATREANERFGAIVVSPDDAVAADVDIYAPCALGGAINQKTIDRIKAKIIAGAANNQLKTPDMDQALLDRDILYCPDYVINAAGVISIGLEILGTWNATEMTTRIDKIGDRLDEIFGRALAESRPTGGIANELAGEIIENKKQAA